MRVLFLPCNVGSVMLDIFNCACGVWCLQYNCAVPHDDVGPGSDALCGGDCSALLPLSLQVSRLWKQTVKSGTLCSFGCLLLSFRGRYWKVEHFVLCQGCPTDSFQWLCLKYLPGLQGTLKKYARQSRHLGLLWHSFCETPFSHSWL